MSGDVAWSIQMSGATPSDPDGLYGAAIFPSVPLAGNVARLVTPALDFGSVEEPVLHFSHKIESNSMWGSEPTLRDTLKLYYKSSQNADWQFIGKYTGTGTTAAWIEESVNLPGISNDYYLAFEAVSAIGTKALYLDDIRIDAAPGEGDEEPEDPVEAGSVSPYIEETFDGLVPEDWVLQGFVHFTSGSASGYGNSIPLRAMLHQNATQAYVQTCPVDMRSAPVISFWYKAMNQITVQGEGGYLVSAEEPTEADKIRYQVLVSNDSGHTWETIQEIAFGQHQVSGDFAQVRIDAAAYANDTCMIRFVFEPNLEIVTGTAQVNLYFDQVAVGTEMGKDLGIASLQGTQLSMPGDSLSFTVEVSNAGSEPQQDYSVRFVQDADGSETEIASETGIPIAKGQTVTYHFNARAAEEPGNLFYYAEVVLDESKTKASFAWNQALESFFDDMESYEAFTVDAIGDYTTMDLDGKETYFWNNVSAPNKNYVGSFMVVDPMQTEPAQEQSDAQAHSGGQYLACFDAVDAVNDDWLVLPGVKVVAGSVFGFFGKSLNSEYGYERFSVWASTTGADNPEDFVKISDGEYMEAADEWTEYSFDLSAYAGSVVYLAIRCVSANSFAFMVDDISVGVPAEAETKGGKALQSFNVFLDEDEVASGIAATEYLFEDLALDQTYTAGVQAVYTTGVSEVSTMVFTTGDVSAEVQDALHLWRNWESSSTTFSKISPVLAEERACVRISRVFLSVSCWSFCTIRFSSSIFCSNEEVSRWLSFCCFRNLLYRNAMQKMLAIRQSDMAPMRMFFLKAWSLYSSS